MIDKWVVDRLRGDSMGQSSSPNVMILENWKEYKQNHDEVQAHAIILPFKCFYMHFWEPPHLPYKSKSSIGHLCFNTRQPWTFRYLLPSDPPRLGLWTWKRFVIIVQAFSRVLIGYGYYHNRHQGWQSDSPQRWIRWDKRHWEQRPAWLCRRSNHRTSHPLDRTKLPNDPSADKLDKVMHRCQLPTVIAWCRIFSDRFFILESSHKLVLGEFYTGLPGAAQL